MAPRWKKTSVILEKVPLKVMFLVTASCLVLQENFPFSDFPMYGSFANYSYYVYVTDAEDQPIPVEGITGVRTSRLKKIYGTRLKEVRRDLESAGVEIKGYQFMTTEQQRSAGEYALEWLIGNCKEHARPELERHRPLRFHKVGLRLTEGEIKSEPALIAEVP